jgi:hypothetical protein
MATKKQRTDRDRQLRERLDVLYEEDTFGGGLSDVTRYPELESRDLTPFDDSVRDWGFLYGLALAANPNLPHEEAAELAYVPALKVLYRWDGGIEDPAVTRENAIRRLVRQFEKADAARDPRFLATGAYPGPIELTPELAGALQDLVESARG